MVDVDIYRHTKDPNKFVGYILMPRDGKQLTVRFDGPDEQTIQDKAKAFWAKHIAPNMSPDGVLDKPARGKSFAGMTWLFNRATGERARVPEDEVAGYLAKGYIKAGPRSQ